MSVGEKITFTNFCELCSKISSVQKPRKLEVLSKFIANWRQLEDELKKSTDVESNFLPALRLLLPHLDRERGAYGIKENVLARIYIRILCLPSDGNDALKLLNFRAPKTAGNQAGDFAEVAYWILKTRCDKGESLTIADVNAHLDAIALKHAEHDPRGVDEELTHLLQCTSAEEQKWLIRIILKDLKMGLGQTSILNSFHVDAKDLYDASNCLRKVCDRLRDPNRRLHEVELELFSPFRPMLSEELPIQNVEHNFNRAQNFFVETKMDGERFQLHMNEGNYKYFSRNGHEYTSFGCTRMDGILTPKLAKQISNEVQNVILDGEMMAWNTNNSSFTSKGMNVDVKNLKGTNVHRPCFCVFDVLYLNGEVLTNKPLFSRLLKLEKIVIPMQGVIMFVPRKKVSSKEEVFDALDNAIDDCDEGIIMKEYNAVYKPNVRKNGGWYKIKPEYTDSLMDTVDMVIIGGYHGGGRHKGSISHFLLGVADNESEPKTFLSAARVGSGYSQQELQELQAKLEPFWQKTVLGQMPESIEWTKDKPDFWIEPSKSVILEVKASEIVPSALYKTGFTLRFPRVKSARYDKAWSDCITLAEFHKKRTNFSGKLTAHHLTFAEKSPEVKVRKTARPAYELGSAFKATDTSNIEVSSNLLKGKEIVVMTDCGNVKKTDIERTIVKYGGTLTMNPGINTWCVVAEDETIQVKNVVASRRHDVVKCSWLLSLLNKETTPIQEEFPRHALIGMSVRTDARLSRHYDPYGDHYTVPANVESLTNCLQVAKKIKLAPVAESMKADFDIELFGDISPHQVFRLLVMWVYVPQETTELPFHLHLAAFDFTFNGGVRTETLNNSVTHVLFNGDPESASTLKAMRRTRSQKFHIVTPQWISSCVASKKRLEESSFNIQMVI